MAEITVEIPGLAELLVNLKNMPEKIQTEIGLEIQASGIQISNQALVRSPIDKGALRGGISYKKIDELTAAVYSNVRYSAYQEFGTGSYVSIPAQPPGVEDIAAGAKGRGLRHTNIHPHPYFFNSMNDETPLLIDRVKNILKDLPNGK